MLSYRQGVDGRIGGYVVRVEAEQAGRSSLPSAGGLIGRRRLLQAGGVGLAVLATGGLLRRPVGSAVDALSSPPSSPADLQVQVLQTAASLENLVVATYAAALELPFVQQNPTIRQFAETTMGHHREHAKRFNAQVEGLGGARQDGPNPKYSQYVATAMPAVSDAAAIVELAATLEEVATDTYMANLALLADTTMRTSMASVMAVESQHLAVLRTFGALLVGGFTELVAIPTDVPALPAATGTVAFPLALAIPNFASPPAEGAVP